MLALESSACPNCHNQTRERISHRARAARGGRAARQTSTPHANETIPSTMNVALLVSYSPQNAAMPVKLPEVLGCRCHKPHS